MSVAIEAVDSDLIQDGSEVALVVLLVTAGVVIGLVLDVVLVVVVATAVDGSTALTNEKSLRFRLGAA
jgi:hypothetical protein